MPFDRIKLISYLISAACALVLTPFLAHAQDPVKVAPDAYKVIVDNDQVRILDAKLAPGQKTAIHSHPDLVAVILDPARIRWTLPGGKSRLSDPNMKRGAVMSMSAETHVSENTSRTPLHVILVEFKKPAPAAGKGGNPTLPAPFRRVADNPHARVFEGRAAPGAKIPQHSHGDHVTIPLTDAVVQLTDKDGKKETQTFTKDTALFSGPGTHFAVNTGKTPIRLIDIELK